jgi:nitrile hydratase beta subunit
MHDLGGRAGFGAVDVEPDEPPFHAPWEARARVLAHVIGGAVGASGGEFRHGIERMDPAHYLTSSYYEHWITGVATLAVEHELFTVAELADRAGGEFPLARPVAPGADAGASSRGREEARFAIGDRVRVRDWRPSGHTRCPWYVRGRAGEVVRLDGRYSIPDVEAHSPERPKEPTYSVRFAADELWGDGQPGVWVHVDLWDSYLERAEPDEGSP